MRITVDYQLWCGVEVDTDTGEIIRVGIGDGLEGEPEQFYNQGCGVENDEPEYLPDDHPEAVKALKIAERIGQLLPAGSRLSVGAHDVPYTLR